MGFPRRAGQGSGESTTAHRPAPPLLGPTPAAWSPEGAHRVSWAEEPGHLSSEQGTRPAWEPGGTPSPTAGLGPRPPGRSPQRSSNPTSRAGTPAQHQLAPDPTTLPGGRGPQSPSKCKLQKRSVNALSSGHPTGSRGWSATQGLWQRPPCQPKQRQPEGPPVWIRAPPGLPWRSATGELEESWPADVQG